jgi:hypothetical protein
LVVHRARRVQRFLSQPFHVAEQFTGIPGVLVDIQETIKAFNMIMDGEVDKYPEAAFNLKGSIEEVIAAGEKMLAEASTWLKAHKLMTQSMEKLRCLRKTISSSLCTSKAVLLKCKTTRLLFLLNKYQNQ